MTPEQLQKLLQRDESLDIEFKGEERNPLSDDELVETVVCLANRSSTAPAWLLVGKEFVRVYSANSCTCSIANCSRAINYLLAQKIMGVYKCVMSVLINIAACAKTAHSYQITTRANISAVYGYDHGKIAKNMKEL